MQHQTASWTPTGKFNAGIAQLASVVVSVMSMSLTGFFLKFVIIEWILKLIELANFIVACVNGETILENGR